jgi:hypothetical protein
MKHLTKLAVFFIAAFAFSFKAPPAVTTTTNEIVPFSQFVFVPCANGGAGEIVEISGNLHILTHTTINGNNASLKSHFQPQGAGGVGQTTGDVYNAVGVTQDQTKISLQNGQGETTFINNFRLIGQGQAVNFQVHQNLHTTVNANGDVTSTVTNTSTECN